MRPATASASARSALPLSSSMVRLPDRIALATSRTRSASTPAGAGSSVRAAVAAAALPQAASAGRISVATPGSDIAAA